MAAELFTDFMRENRDNVERALNDELPRSGVAGAETFNDALQAAVFPGGKRLRAHATHIAAKLGGSSEEQALALACAIEFLHTSSLVLDDLPSMDAADLRRGRPALHLVFGEGIAILVALSLLNQAYALLARATPANQIHSLLAEVSRCIGSEGMIAGQATELAFGGEKPTEGVMGSRDLKTTALMRLMLVAGPIAAGGLPKDEIDALASFGEMLGRLFQLCDDLADLLGDRASTGKSVGQDARHSRLSESRSAFLRGTTREKVIDQAEEMLVAGKAMLDRFGDRSEARLLQSAADCIMAVLGTFTATRD